MLIDPKEVVDYIDASNNVISLQQEKIAELEKEASDMRFQLEELNKQAHTEPPEADSYWGAGEKRETESSNMRESDKVLMQRFGVYL